MKNRIVIEFDPITGEVGYSIYDGDQAQNLSDVSYVTVAGVLELVKQMHYECVQEDWSASDEPLDED